MKPTSGSALNRLAVAGRTDVVEASGVRLDDDPVAVIGCGVIGGGWVARSALAGRTVRWVDPAANAADRLDAVLDRAERSWAALGLGPIGSANGYADGQRSPVASVARTSSIAEAVDGASVVIEALPERLELKASAYIEVESAAPADALLVSSTSGLRPTALQASLVHPERLVVGHPFNPVYLLPLVEVVGGEQTASTSIERAMSFFRALHMEPLHVRVEIDAFIADRLLEAVWREALWLVNDGVATTDEIDDAIRFGFGLRWAQMGLFETYRVAGGEGGMSHFIAQFGETLNWPWTKLMDTPELTPELVAEIGEQSDAQSGHLSIAELEEARDQNLVAILAALAGNEWGAGQVVSRARRRRQRGVGVPGSEDVQSQPAASPPTDRSERP